MTYTSPSDLVRGLVRRTVTAMQLVTRVELHVHLEELENKIMTAFQREDEAVLRLVTYLGVLMAENRSVHASLIEKDAALRSVQAMFESEVSGRDAEIKRQVDEALALDAERDAVRIEELIRQAQEGSPVPPVEVETPDAGEPAPIPPDSDIEPVDESQLPPLTGV